MRGRYISAQKGEKKSHIFGLQDRWRKLPPVIKGIAVSIRDVYVVSIWLAFLHPSIQAFVWLGQVGRISNFTFVFVCVRLPLCRMSKFILIRWVLDNALDVCPLSALENKETRAHLLNDADAIGPLRGSRVVVKRWEEPDYFLLRFLR